MLDADLMKQYGEAIRTAFDAAEHAADLAATALCEAGYDDESPTDPPEVAALWNQYGMAAEATEKLRDIKNALPH